MTLANSLNPSACVYYAQVSQCSEAGMLPRYVELLSAAEYMRWRQFKVKTDADSYLVSRALVRCALGDLVKIPPNRLVFEADERGKPHVREINGRRSDWHFNLSHTHGLSVVCIAKGRIVGIDTEPLWRHAPLSVAKLFSLAEFHALCSVGDDAAGPRFWALWTLKEAYLKANGCGLAGKLDEPCFASVLERPSVPIRVASGLGHWWLTQWRLMSNYMVSVCIEIDSGQSTNLLVEHAEHVPLLGT